MTGRRGVCRYCHRPIALTTRGLIWTHGQPQCRGSRTQPSFDSPRPHYWPARHHGRRVTLVPGPDTWNPREEAA